MYYIGYNDASKLFDFHTLSCVSSSTMKMGVNVLLRIQQLFFFVCGEQNGVCGVYHPRKMVSQFPRDPLAVANDGVRLVESANGGVCCANDLNNVGCFILSDEHVV